MTLEKQGEADDYHCPIVNIGARFVVNAAPRPIYPRERPGTSCI
jgi:hypothetical protein